VQNRTPVTIPYGEESLTFSVPSPNLLGSFWPQPVAAAEDVAAEIRQALAAPIGGPGLAELVAGAGQVLLIGDDGTRPTPTDIIVPILLDALNAAGVPDRAIQLLIALGTHRPMSAEEIRGKFGAEAVRRIEILNHEPFTPEALVDLGTTPGGVHVTVNRRVLEAERVIGIGSIVPHHIPGFSGGAKIIQPGVCGERTTGEVHLLSVRHRMSLMGVVENRVRQEMEAIAARAGLRAIVNTVLNAEGGVVGAVFGEPCVAFREGVTLSRRVYGVEVPALADIVVAGSHPCDSEFWQAHKTLYSAELCVKPGGTIIIVTPCPEGVAATHPGVLEFGGKTWDEIEAGIASGAIHDLTGAALTLAWANARERASVSIVSGGITDDEARALSFVPFPTVDAALEEAFARHGEGATVTVLPFAPDTLPILP
jgi:nickel-dependent lactate racemase